MGQDKNTFYCQTNILYDWWLSHNSFIKVLNGIVYVLRGLDAAVVEEDATF